MTGEKSQEIQKQEGRVSQLNQLREQLKNNGDVFVAGECIDPDPEKALGIEDFVEIFIAPVNPIYDIDKLNQFMYGLFPKIDSIEGETEKTRKYGSEEIILGFLNFREKIGETTKETTTTTTTFEPEILKRDKIPIGTTCKTKTYDLERLTQVRIFPNAYLAKLVFDVNSGIKNGTVNVNNRTVNRLSTLNNLSVEQWNSLKDVGKLTSNLLE